MEDEDKIHLKKEIGQKIKNIRTWKNLSRQQAADALSISVTNYGYIERGETDLPVSRLVDIAKVFEVSVDDLLGLTDKTVFTFSGNNNSGFTNYQVNSHLIETTEIALKYELEKMQILLQERENEVTGLKKQIAQLEEINRMLKGEK